MAAIIGGRRIGEEEIEHAVEVARRCSGLSRREIALTLCEHWEWISASGAPKDRTCMKLLAQLEAAGRVGLRAKREVKRPLSTRPLWTKRTEPGCEVRMALSLVGRIELQVVTGTEENRLWKEYVDRYHYLNWKEGFGCRLRYFVRSRVGLLGCISVSGAAKSVAVRDGWIGWTKAAQRHNLAWVINNYRYLLFPWVAVPHLASHVLGQLARQMRADWYQHWGYRPVLMETFVDPARYRGTCYRAAGWTELGMTSGRGRVRPGRQYTTTPKRIFVRPLVRDFRAQLCAGKLIGRAAQ